MSAAVGTASQHPRSPERPRGLRAWLVHALCLLSLMWTPLANGQAFFFYDTTNYIRAADMALYLASGKSISTVWTDRYSRDLERAQAKESSEPRPTATSGYASHNSIATGHVMSGRSPYIGALMYLGYLVSNFWLFIALQAAISYFLILLALRSFGIVDARRTTIATLIIAAGTAVSYYNGLLLADAFAAFGALAFLILASQRDLARWQVIALSAIIAVSVVSHLTHIVIHAALTLGLLLLVCLRMTEKVPVRAWVVGAGSVLLGFASVQVTAIATEAALGNKPQLLPLFTSRFLADGPGLDFIQAGCEDDRFQVCRVAIGDVSSASIILSAEAPVGTYLGAAPEERRLMGEEDVGFALAVFRFDPLGVAGAIARNTFTQLTWVEYGGLNVGCFENARCWSSLPEPVRTQLVNSLSGRNAWPQAAFDALQDATVFAAIALLAVALVRRSGMDGDNWRQLRNWLVLTGLAMLAVAGFGGGIVEPQYRYITRMIWLLPLFAMIAAYRLDWSGMVQRRQSAAI